MGFTKFLVNCCSVIYYIVVELKQYPKFWPNYKQVGMRSFYVSNFPSTFRTQWKILNVLSYISYIPHTHVYTYASKLIKGIWIFPLYPVHKNIHTYIHTYIPIIHIRISGWFLQICRSPELSFFILRLPIFRTKLPVLWAYELSGFYCICICTKIEPS